MPSSGKPNAKIITAVAVTAVILIAGISYLIFKGEEGAPGKEIPAGEWIEKLNEASSVRTSFVEDKVLVIDLGVDGGAEVSVAASSAAVYRAGNDMRYNPVIIRDQPGNSYDRYLRLTEREEEVVAVTNPTTTTVELAGKVYQSSDFMMVYSSYSEGLKGVALASYYNMPMIYAPEITDDVRALMDDLDVKYVISVGDSPAFGIPTMGLDSGEGPCYNEFFLDCLESRGDSTDYVVVTNPGDVDNDWGEPGHMPIAGMSTTASQVIAYRKALSIQVNGYNQSELSINFDDIENYNQMGAEIAVANGYSDIVKDRVLHAWNLSTENSALDLEYLGIVGDPIGVPYHYRDFDPDQTGISFSNTRHVASDYYFSDLEGDEKQEISYGRITAGSLTDASLLCIRSLGFDEYSEYDFERGQDIDQRVYDTLSPDWKENAGVFIGTSKPVPMPGALKHMKKYQYDVLRDAGMFVTSEEAMLLNDVAADMVMDKMNYMMYCGHGLQWSWYSNRVDNIDSRFVSTQNLKPGFTAVMACLTGRTDNLDDEIADMISQSFIHAGLNGYIGSSRLAYGLFQIGDGDQGLLLDTGALYLVDCITDHFAEGGMTIGELLKASRNDLIEKWGEGGSTENNGEAAVTVWEYVLYGDPAWTPAY